MSAGEKNLRPTLFAAHIINISANPVAVAEGLARQGLIAPNDGFAAPEVDNDIAVFDTLDDAVDDLADAVLELIVLPLALGVANLLDDHLLGVLGGDAAEIDRRKRLGDEIAKVGGGILMARLG